MASAWGIIIDKGDLLLVQRAPDRGRAGQWCIPGGRIKPNETSAEACQREVLEETGLEVEIISLQYLVKTESYFLCRLVSSRNDLELREIECVDFRWVSPQNILDVGMIMDLKRLQPILSEQGFEVIIE